jgi:hypothetical protein
VFYEEKRCKTHRMTSELEPDEVDYHKVFYDLVASSLRMQQNNITVTDYTNNDDDSLKNIR